MRQTRYAGQQYRLSYWDALAFGYVRDAFPVNKFGRNPDVSSGTVPEDVTTVGGVYPGFLSAAAQLQIVSDSANDAVGGTGWQYVDIHGLDLNGELYVERVGLDGLTPVTLSDPFLRQNRVTPVSVGSGNVNDGNIAVSTVVGGTVMSNVLAGRGQTLLAVYTVPKGYCFKLKWWKPKVGADLAATVLGEIALQIDKGAGWQTQDTDEISSGGGDTGMTWETPLEFPELTDIRCTVNSISGNNRNVSARFGGACVLVEN
jgi:hypothetical protein